MSCLWGGHLLIDKDLHEIEKSLHLCVEFLNVPIIHCLLFISKNYPLFMLIFMISILLYFNFPLDLLFRSLSYILTTQLDGLVDSPSCKFVVPLSLDEYWRKLVKTWKSTTTINFCIFLLCALCFFRFPHKPNDF